MCSNDIGRPHFLRRRARDIRELDSRPRRRWRRLAALCAAVAAFVLSAGTAHAGSITLAWNATTTPNPTGYLVFYGTASHTYTSILVVGNQTSATVHGLADGQTYYFAVEAFSSTGGPGDISNEVSGSTTNTPPQLTTPGPQVSGEGMTIALSVQVFDAENDPLAFTATGLPDGLAIDPATGVIGGTIAFTAAGPHTVTVTASDGPTSSSVTFSWFVQDVDRAPLIGAIANQSNPVGSVVSLTIPTVDPDGSPLTFSAQGLPPGTALDTSAGVTSGTLTVTGSYAVTVTASDGTLAVSRSFTWTVLAANSAPTLAPPGDQESSVVNVASLQLVASDPDGNTLMFSATGLPPGLVLNPATGLIAGQPTTTGAYPVSVAVTDGIASASRGFTWTIDPSRPPTITSPGPQSSLERQLVSLQIAATDPDGRPLTFSASLPPGLSIDDHGFITGAVPSGNAGSYTAVVSVWDGAQSDSISFPWTVSVGSPTPPTVVAEAHFAVDRNTAVPNRADLSINVSGTNPLLIVAFHSELDGGDTNWSVQSNGIPGTLLANLDGYFGPKNNHRFQIYYWANPPQGTNAIVVQNTYLGSNELAVSAIVLNNVLPGAPLGAVASNLSTTPRTSESETVATATSDLVVHIIADASFVRGTLSSGETSVSIANDGLQKTSPGDGDASLWVSTKIGQASSTTVGSTGWPSSPAPAPRVVNGAAIVVHGTVPVLGPDLRIASTHIGAFTQGATGAAYSLTVTNTGSIATVGAVTATEVVPVGLTATAMTGPGWSCAIATLTCTRSDSLAPGASYPSITVTVSCRRRC